MRYRGWPSRALLPGLAAATLSLTAGVAPASAAGYDGYCQDSSGTTVVVDFQQLGGGVVVRCAAPLPSSGTGLDALRAAGVPYEGVRRYGDAFICRLYGEPSATAELAVQGNPGYQEHCIDTPPAGAYWSYWSATNGGSWTYSPYGVRDRSALPGGFEGWSFALNATSSRIPAPRVRPLRPTDTTPPAAQPPARPPAQPTARPPAQPPPAGRSSASRHGRPGSTSAKDSASSTREVQGPRSSGPTTPLSTSTSRSTTTSGAVTGRGRSATSTSESRTSGSMPAGAAGPAGPAGPADSPASSTALDPGVAVSSARLPPTAAPGSSPATLVGTGLLTFLLVAGIGTAWRRRRTG